jgi:hypothetical protein
MAALSPEIAMDRSSGHTMVIWARTSGGTDTYMASPYESSTGTWGSTVAVDSSVAPFCTATVGIDHQGNAVMAWERVVASGANSGQHRITAARYQSGGWSTPVNVGASLDVVTREGCPAIAVSPAGNAMVAWSSFFAGTTIWYNQLNASSNAWSGPAVAAQLQPVDPNATVSSSSGGTTLTLSQPSVRIAIDAYEQATLAWNQVDTASGGATTGAVWTKRYTAGGWQPSVPLTPTNASTFSTAAPPVLVVNSNGAAAVSWVGYDGSLRVSVAQPGAAWSQPNYLMNPPPTPPNAPIAPAALGIDDQGDVFAAWAPYTLALSGVNYTVPWTAKYSAATDTWSTPTMYYNNADAYGASYIALDANGSGHSVLAWLQSFNNTSTPGPYAMTGYVPAGN